MFEYIKGTLVHATMQKAVIDVHGLGFSLLIPLSTYAKLPEVGQSVLLYISPVIREDSHRYFGFSSPEERDHFELVSEVSGIGPKTALALIGHLDMENLESAIATANVPLLSKIPGIGKKTAERLIVEMRDKMAKNVKKSFANAPQKGGDLLTHDAMNALIHLGYNPLQAQKAVQKARAQFSTPPELTELIGCALKGV